jgi:hypothetical protein
MGKFEPIEVNVSTPIRGLFDTYEISEGLVLAAALNTEPTAVIAVSRDGMPFNPVTQGEKLADWIFENLPSGTAEATRNRLIQRFLRERGGQA